MKNGQNHICIICGNVHSFGRFPAGLKGFVCFECIESGRLKEYIEKQGGIMVRFTPTLTHA